MPPPPHDPSSGTSPDSPASPANLLLSSHEAVGQCLGRYRLLEKLGEGGGGIVYVAEQTEPVRRQVALKIIKLGMDTRAVVARFELERQALAMMNHPNIAKVLDAGATATGRPYFVMELASGFRITEYCERHHLPLPQRIALFIAVCHAVQHAHQKGIVHRDLKPSNILVVEHEGGAVPKVIDFGIAMATDQDPTAGSGLTSIDRFLGTPPYMSPEQVEFGTRDIDTRADIYSLGVILYELLAGQPPFDPKALMDAGLDEMRRIIREVDPPRPSDCLARDLNPNRLPTAAGPSRERIAAVRGDLDWIVMKCLEKDRTRRYETANGLAFDLRRYLANEPVNARPPTALYHVQKAIRRHRILFGAAVAVSAALVLGLSVSVWQARRARASELQARRTAYNSDVTLAQQALAANNLGRAQSLLQRHQPRPGEPDLRGWEWRYLWGQTRPDEHQILVQGTNRQGLLAFSPDGRNLALELQGSIRFWNIASRTWDAWQTQGRLPAFARQSNLLAYIRPAPATGDVVVVRAPAQAAERRSLPQSGNVLAQAFTADASGILVLTAQPTTQAIYSPTYKARRVVIAWDLATGEPRWRQPIEPVEESTPATLAVSPDGTSFAVAVSGGRFRIHDATTGRERLTVLATPEFVTALAFSADGQTIASGAGYTDATIHLWDTRTGTLRGRLEGHRSWITNMDFSRDGRHLVSGSADQTIRRWDLSTLTVAGVFRGHGYAINGIAVSPDGQTLASNTLLGETFLWPLDRPPAHPSSRRLPVRLTTAVFSPDSQSVLGVQPDGTILEWDVASLSERKRWPSPPAAGPRFLRLDNEARRAAWFGPDGSAGLGDLRTDTRTTLLPPGTEPVVDCLFTHGGRYLVVVVQGPTDATARIWDLDQGRFTGSLPLDQASAFTAPAIPHTLVVAARGGLHLWDVSRTQTPPRVLADDGDFSGFDATLDGTRGVAAFTESYLRLWDLRTLQPIGTLRGLLLGAHSVAFSPDATRIAAGSNGQEAVMIWDAATGQEVLSLGGEGSLFEQVRFSPDGRHLLAINAAGLPHLWSAPDPDRTRPRNAPPR